MSHCLTYPPCSLFNFARKNSLEKERFIPSSFPFSFYQARIEFWHLKKLVFVQACCSSEEKVNTPSQKAFYVSIPERGNRRVKACAVAGKQESAEVSCSMHGHFGQKSITPPSLPASDKRRRGGRRWARSRSVAYIPLRRYPKPLKECTLRPKSRNRLRMLPIALRSGRIETTRFSSSSLWLSSRERSKRLATIVS